MIGIVPPWHGVEADIVQSSLCIHSTMPSSVLRKNTSLYSWDEEGVIYSAAPAGLHSFEPKSNNMGFRMDLTLENLVMHDVALDLRSPTQGCNRMLSSSFVQLAHDLYPVVGHECDGVRVTNPSGADWFIFFDPENNLGGVNQPGAPFSSPPPSAVRQPGSESDSDPSLLNHDDDEMSGIDVCGTFLDNP